MSARDYQVGGTHYQRDLQPWDIIESYNLNFWEGNAIKYICRQKGDRVEDLEKAIHYLKHEIDRLLQRDVDEAERKANEDLLPPDMIQCQACSLLYHGNPVDSFCPRCNCHSTYKPL